MEKFYSLLQNTNIPYLFFVVGIMLIGFTFLNMAASRKVTLKKRTSNKNGNLVFKVVSALIIKKLQNKKVYNNILDKGQFIYGYFSSESEKFNRKKFEEFLIKLVTINIFLDIAIFCMNLNIGIKILIICTVLLIQYIIINSSIVKRKTKLKDDFHILVREFIEAYVTNKNVAIAFEIAANKLSPVYQVHINRLVNQLNSVSGFDAAFKAFDRRIDYSMCSCFISVVESAFATQKDVIENLLQLQEMLSEDRIEEKNKLNKLSSANNNIILWIVMCIIEIIVVGIMTNTSSGNYFISTYIGQRLLMANIIFIIIAIVAMKIADYI